MSVCRTAYRACRYVIRNRRGQATVEFAVVTAAFICVCLGLGALWHLFADGTVLAHALASASHHLSASDVGAWGDVLVY